MGKGLLRIVAGLTGMFLAVLILPYSSWAGTFVDDMTDLNSNDIKTYSNLTPFPMTQNFLTTWARLPDLTMHTFASTASPMATAAYRISGAETVTVSLYTYSGTFVAAKYDDATRYTLGPSSENLGYLNRQSLVQARFSPSQNAIYTRIDGSLMKAHNNGLFYEFYPTDDSPSDLIGYGVNVYASSDGANYTPVTLRMTNLVREPGILYVYEQYSAVIPTGTAYVRVELNDTNRMHLAETKGSTTIFSSIAKRNTTMASLASVAFSGNDLVLGSPGVLSSESDPLPQSDSHSEEEPPESVSSAASPSSSKKASSSKAPAASSQAGTVTSKFEGVIVSSGSSSQSEAGGSAAPSSSKSKVTDNMEQPEESVVESEEAKPYLAPETTGEMENGNGVLYEIRSGGGSGTEGFSKLVIGYIVGVCALILFVLLRIKK